jgi:putative membrane protein
MVRLLKKTEAPVPYKSMERKLYPHELQEREIQPRNIKVTDHLANERTFLAWIRTALAVITSGLALGRLGSRLHVQQQMSLPLMFSSTLLEIVLTVLGTVLILIALLHFLSLRRSIEREQFQVGIGFVILLTVISSLMGITLALYLMTT